MPSSRLRKCLLLAPFSLATGLALASATSCGVPQPTFQAGRDTHPTGTCTDGLLTDTETDVDCGGPCPKKCSLGTHCFDTTDCATDLSCVTQSDGKICLGTHCQNQTVDSDESATDCGGATCFPCADGLSCKKDQDCTTGRCADGTCTAPTCTDLVTDGAESDTDCGGTCDPCPPDAHCNRNEDCTSKSCVNGRCDLICPTGTAECNPGDPKSCETNVYADSTNCGGCGKLCTFPHAEAVCSGGNCSGIKPNSCEVPFADCDSDFQNGCETDTSTSVLHCGKCRQTCPETNGTARCSNGTCTIACTAGWDDCNKGTAEDGCESKLDEDAKNCGICGNTCIVKTGLTAFCKNGVCDWRQCPEVDYGDCDGDGTCTNHLTEDPKNCGTCGNKCLPQNGTGKCDNKACAIDTCNPGWGDCDGKYSNGCETDLNTTPGHCKTCSNDCNQNLPGAATQCVAGECKQLSCIGNLLDCTTAPGCETDSTSSAAHCGACMNAACEYPHAGGKCVNSLCQMTTCVAGYDDCDPNVAGCEAQLSTDPTNCGKCGTTCSTAASAHASTNTCSASTCHPTCLAGYDSCNNIAADGCETSLKTKTDCGGCGVKCDFANTTENCDSGTCTVTGCATGFADCDKSSPDCEASILTDASHCGSCSPCNLAGASATCSGGVCKISACDATHGNCDGRDDTGCEADLANSPDHCGSCAACSTAHIPTPTCSNKICNGACEAGWSDADGNKALNGCEHALVTVESQNIDTSPGNNNISVQLRLCSAYPGGTLNVGGWRLRYWFTADGATVGSTAGTILAGTTLTPNIVGGFPVGPGNPGASEYFDVTFPAGTTLPAMGCSSLITVVYLTNGSNPMESACAATSPAATCDFSYQTFAGQNSKIGVFMTVGSTQVLVAGTAP